LRYGSQEDKRTAQAGDIGGHILLVDDELPVRDYLSTLFEKHNFPVIACCNAQEAMSYIQKKQVSLVLTDIIMPMGSGIELLEEINKTNSGIPVVMMTGHADAAVTIEALNKGAFGFLTKPFKQEDLMSMVKRGLEHHRLTESERNYMTKLENVVMRKTRELEDTAMTANRLSLELVHRLSAVAEFRDSYTAAHISRIGFYSRKIAETMNMYNDFVEAVTVASSLHDIGKIGIPDKILLKKTSLTDEEYDIIKEHTIIGSKILADSSHPTIQMASSIALNHHEQWDGSGYPRKLRGKEIPVEARIVKLADQYDALRSRRSYKPSLDHEEAYRIMMEGDNRTSSNHFDPEVLEVFSAIAPQFDEIFTSNPD